MRYLSLFLTIFCNLLYTCVLFSATFLSSPIQLPSGETVLGLGYLSGFRISPDNQTLLLYGTNGIFFIKDDHIIQKRLMPEQFISRCDYSPDGSKLFIAKYDLKTDGGLVYDLKNEKNLLYVFMNGSGVSYPYIAVPTNPFSPDGKNFIYYQTSGATIAHLETWKQTFLSNLALTMDSFYSDNQQIINTQIRDSSPYLVIWDAQTGNEIRSVPLVSPYHLIDSRGDLWSPRNGVSVLGWGNISGSIIGYYWYQVPIPMTNGMSEEIYIHVWDSLTGKVIKKWGVRDEEGSSIAEVMLSPNRRWVVLYTKYYSAELIDLNKELSEKPEPDLGPFDHAFQTEFTPDSQSLYFLSSENNGTKYTISQLELDTDTFNDKRYLYQLNRNGNTFSPDGRYLAIYDATDAISLLDWKQGTISTTLLTTIPTNDDGGRYQLAFSPNGKLLLSGNSKTYSLWDTGTDKQIKNFSTGDQPTQITVAFSRDGSKFLTSGYIKANTPQPYIVKIWDTETLLEIRSLNSHTSTILSAHFSPDGKQVITASEDQTAKIWDVATGQLISTYIHQATGLYYTAFLPDGKQAVIADYDHTIHLLNPETGEAQTILQNVKYPVVLSPNGKCLFAGTQVWDTANWKIIKVLDGKEMDLNSLVVSPDNQWLLTSETNGITKVWSIEDQIIKPLEIKQFQEYLFTVLK